MSSTRFLRPLVAAIVFAVSLGVYIATLAPTVGLVDSGALTVAAWSLGNAHPPGFPLYLLLTHVFTLLPFGESVAWRANFASAFFASAACAMVAMAAWELLAYAKKKDEARPPLVLALVSLFAGLLLAFARTLWAYATVAEVYALNTFLVATIFWLMLRWRRTGTTRDLYFAALVFGLALGVHHVTVGLTLLGIAVLVFRTAGGAFFRSRAFGIAALLAIVALIAIYAYLPVAAARHPALNWGDPDDLSGVIKHVGAEQYRSYLTGSEQGSQFGDVFRLVGRELGPRWLPLALLLAVAGFAFAFRRDRTLFWMLLLIVLAGIGWMVVYPIVNDEDAYLLPAIVGLVLAAAYGAAHLTKWRTAFSAALLVLPVLALAVHWPERDRSRFWVGKDYVDNTLRTVGDNALLITGDWQLYSPLFYFLEVEKIRPDVKALQYGMLIRGWYIEQLERRYPDLFARVRKELDAYKPLLKRFEEGGPQWDNDGVAQQAFQQGLDDLTAALIRAQTSSGGRAYATSDVAMSREEVDQPLVRRLAAEYDLVPRGIAIEYARGQGSSSTVDPVPFQLRGLAESRDEVVRGEVVPAYRTVYLLRGRHFALAKQWDEAIAAYEQALALDPENGAIKRELAQVRFASTQ